MGLTLRQAEVLKAFRLLQRETGRPPTIRELCRKLGLASTRTVHDHLKALEAQGKLVRRRGARGWRPPGAEGLPVLGRVAAGAPLLAEQNLDGALDLGTYFGVSESLFLLQVNGESMRDAGILPGDHVVVDAKAEVGDSEVGVVLVEGEVTVKRLARRGRILWLHPANEAFRPIAVDLRAQKARVLGKVVGVVRRVD